MKQLQSCIRHAKAWAVAVRLLIACCALVALIPPLQAGPAKPKLEADIAALKARMAALAAPARATLDALSPQARLTAPPAIWRPAGAPLQFKDCARCPQMVVIPPGEFTMGSPPAAGQAEKEHRVTIMTPFAAGKFAITFAEWDDCVKSGGCEGYRPDDQGWGRGRRPAIDISWDLAHSYVEWLAKKTGKPYRLLTEAEWEYAARAGTITKYSTGDTISPKLANYDGSGDGTGPSAVNRQKTLPVGSFPPNAFGLYDMHGNVTQWVEDCWHEDYTEAAPSDGSAWLDGSCEGRVLRGGSWADSEGELRSAARTGEYKDVSSYNDGFRVARGL